jgi:argininosuccinate synthase
MIDRRIGKIKVRRGTDSQRKLVTFEEGGAYDQRDAEGFIKLNALRLRTLAKRAARGAKKY